MNAIFQEQNKKQHAWIFFMFFALTFALYLPTAKAGWVIDAVGWIYDMKHNSFWDFINRTQSHSQSFYQLFALHYFVCYKLWGMNLWMWSLLYITIHAINAYLLFVFCSRLLSDSGINNGLQIALGGAILFTVSPHISEVIAWKACFHYLQGLLFILLITLWVQKFQHNQQGKYALYSAIIFILSAFGLEIFYVIPFFTLFVSLYYPFALGYDKKVFRKTLLYFFVPQLITLCIYFIALYIAYGFFRPHKTDFSQSATDYLSKPVKYFFQILFLVRYYPVELKNRLYSFCESSKTFAAFYGIAAFIFFYALVKLKKIGKAQRAMFLFYVLVILTIGFLISVPFPGSDLLVFYDRYTYFADGFIYTLLALILTKAGNKYFALILLCVYAAVNVYFTIKVNTYWKHSAYVDARLLYDLPPAGTKTYILLNVPENMKGVPMIGAQPSSKFRDTYEVFMGTPMKNNIYDAASYNMNTMEDGAHVMVINDSVIHVTLNQWGTWWWYEGHGARSYENNDYRLKLVDPGHWYELTLRHPADQYLLLYEVGAAWKMVDMNRKNQDQY
jgi:hypothetical protein